MHPETLKNCIECDVLLTKDVPQGAFKSYLCKNNLWDNVTPLVVGGRHVGNLFTGQFFYEGEKPDDDIFRSQAARYGFDEQEYMAAVRRVPTWNREGIQTALVFYTKFANMIASLSHANIILAKTLEDRKRVEAALRESNDLMSLFMKHSPIFTYIKDVTPTQSRVLRASENFGDMIGIPGSAITGKTMEEIFPAEFAAKITADDLSVVMGGKVLTLDEELNGRYYTTVKFPIVYEDKNLLAGYTLDITDRKQMENSLREAHQFNEQVINSAQEGVIVYDTALRYKVWNPFMERLSGMPACKVLGRQPLEVFPFLEEAGIIERLAKVLAGESVAQVEFSFKVASSGKSGWNIDTSGPLLNTEGEIIGVIGMVSDITERKQAEEEKKKLEAELLQAQKMQAIGQLAGGVAHDFNNILAAISSIGYLLEMQLKENDKGLQYVAELMQAVDRAAVLTHSLLTFSRKQHSNPQPVDLNSVIRKTEKILGRTISEDIRLVQQLTEERTTVHADSNQIVQILMNLATNARDAMPKGGEFTISTECIYLDEAFMKIHDYGRCGHYILMTVSDNGTGMDAATMHRAFEPFFTTKEVGKGTGLGLSIIYGIVKQHNGYVDLYSKKGKGTQVKVYLPVIDTEVEEKESNGSFRTEGATETILLVEDDSALRRAMTQMLQRFGHTVIEAHDGDDAISKFRKHRDEVHLVLMDVIMPRKSGGDAYQELKDIRPDLKIILMSGYAGDFLSGRVSMDGDVQFIPKPVSPKELYEKIRTVLGGGTA